jgi:UPF0271 protein
MHVDINCDLGEGTTSADDENDRQLLELVTSANLACGLHAGDPYRMWSTIETSRRNGVALGAHVSYNDRPNFGRVVVERSRDELVADILYQLGSIAALAKAQGATISYVKPHGALYNRIVTDEAHAQAVAEAITIFDPSLKLLTLPGSVAEQRATQMGVEVRREGFADRGYHSDGTLVARSHPGAIITDPETVAQRGRDLVCKQELTTIEGDVISLSVDSLCIHSDTPGAVALARRLRSELESNNVSIRPFVP